MVTVSERVASEQGNTVAAPNTAAIDLEWTFHIPVIDPSWTRRGPGRGHPTFVIQSFIFEVPPCRTTSSLSAARRFEY